MCSVNPAHRSKVSCSGTLKPRWMSASQHGDRALALLVKSGFSKATSLPAWIKSECYFFIQQTSWTAEYKDVRVSLCVYVCVCARFRSVVPSGHSLPVTSGQFALALPLSISHRSSDHLLPPRTVCLPKSCERVSSDNQQRIWRLKMHLWRSDYLPIGP